MDFEDMTYEQKYNYVITRLKYALSPYFEGLMDVNDEEIINTACDDLAIWIDSVINK